MTKSEFYTQLPLLTKSLKPFAFNMTKNSEDAEDLIQDTIYRALKNFEKFKPDTNLKAWLYTVMKNIFINNYRKKSKYQMVTDPVDNDILLNNCKIKTYNLADRQLLQEELNTVLKSIKPELSKPFVMHHQGFKYEEISSSLEVPLGTVKSRIFLAKKEMQQVLVKRGIDSTYKF